MCKFCYILVYACYQNLEDILRVADAMYVLFDLDTPHYNTIHYFRGCSEALWNFVMNMLLVWQEEVILEKQLKTFNSFEEVLL